jgi:hypothetical protein
MSAPSRSLRRAPTVTFTALLVVLAAAVAALLGGAMAGADDPVGSIAAISTPAVAGAVATRLVTPTTDLVSVYERSNLSAGVRDRALAAAQAAGDPATVTRGFTIGMSAVRRGGAAVFRASAPGAGLWQVPMNVTAMPPAAIASVMGTAVSAPVGAGQVVISTTTAAMHGAQAGDTLDLVASSGALIPFTVGLVATDDITGGSEIVMSTDQAGVLGATTDTSVLIYGQINRSGIDVTLGQQGLLADGNIRVRHSWDPQDPDSTLGLAATKTLLGEFSYRVADDDSVSVDPAWQAKYIPPVRELYSGVGIRAACNNVIKGDLQAALTDITNAGLAGLIDTANTNTAGGCFGPRFNRISGNLGILSRHSWGQPLDTNTLQNCQGCVPKMDCRIVRIFRSHGFAWGGDFLFPDGMHFEWTGRKTDQLAYPSRYCPNPTVPATESIATPAPRSTFFDVGTAVLGVAGDG